jgi:hypothetical protein
MKTAKHHYATADTHAATIGIILATIALLALCRFLGIEDITGVLLFPTLFAYPILRCLWDWIFIIATVISVTAKYIFTTIRKVVNHSG